MAIADDTALVQLAPRPAQELFPVLNRAGTFAPLVAVLAVLPGLAALHHRELDDRAALWGLKSLAVLTAADLDEFVDPQVPGGAEGLNSQPPLGSWLTALAMWACGPSWPVSLLLTSYLATAGVVAMSYVVFRRLAGSRVALWGAVMLAFHGPVLAQASDPAPVSLAILLALVALWGYLVHLDRATSPATGGLLVGGIALGLCLLAGGPLAAAIPLVLLASAGKPPGAGQSAAGPSAAPKRIWQHGTALRAVGLFALTGFAVGGWWVLMMASRHGGEFFVEWLTGGAAGELGISAGGGLAGASAQGETRQGAAALAASAIRQTVGTFGLLIGFSVLGFWRAARIVIAPRDRLGESERRALRLLLAWAGSSLVVWLVMLGGSIGSRFALDLWRGMLLVSAVGLSAFAVEEIAHRRVSLPGVAGVVAMSLAAPLASWLVWPGADGNLAPLLWRSSLVLAMVVVVAWAVCRFCPDREARQRLTLTALVIGLVAANSIAGLRSLESDNHDERALAEFRHDLRQVSGVDAAILVTKDKFPVRLRYAIGALWPGVSLTAVEDWSAAASLVLATPPERARNIIAVQWTADEDRRGDAAAEGWEMRAVGSPQFYRQRELRAYLLAREGIR